MDRSQWVLYGTVISGLAFLMYLTVQGHRDKNPLMAHLCGTVALGFAVWFFSLLGEQFHWWF